MISCNVNDPQIPHRKSTAQKMLHIQSCSRKKALSDETVQVLILQEIENALPVDNATKRKGKGKETGEPKTFLENILDDAAPRRKGKRPEITKTVRNVIETRDVILDRAKAILDDFPSLTREEHYLDSQTQIFHPSKLVDKHKRGNLLQTKSFGENMLRREQTIHSPDWLTATTSNQQGSGDSDVEILVLSGSGTHHKSPSAGDTHLDSTSMSPFLELGTFARSLQTRSTTTPALVGHPIMMLAE